MTAHPARRLVVCLVALALVAAQLLGLMHRVLHVPVAGTSSVASMASTASPVLKSLFAGHEGDASCRLYDSLGHDFAPPAPAIVLPLALCAVVLEVLRCEFVARWAALFDARGPPSLT
jgi:hypothetical protein